MKNAFSQTKRATEVFPPKFDEAKYFERTKRNHYWLGGKDIQKRLSEMRVGVAGLGGIGSNVAEILVRLGVGHIKITDPDIIEASNLNRQVIANQSTLQMKKAYASAQELRNIAEDFELVVYDDGLTEENADEFVSDLDVVVDEIDVFPIHAHVCLHQAARKKNLPLYSGYVIGMGTHVYKFQGSEYTFEDFMLNNKEEMNQPTAKFMMNRFCSPLPFYMASAENQSRFIQNIEANGVPIFGASTYMSQSLITIRLITDFLKLDENWNGPKTPIMPRFMKLDPFAMSFDICDIREHTPQNKS